VLFGVRIVRAEERGDGTEREGPPDAAETVAIAATTEADTVDVGAAAGTVDDIDSTVDVGRTEEPNEEINAEDRAGDQTGINEPPPSACNGNTSGGLALSGTGSGSREEMCERSEAVAAENDSSWIERRDVAGRVGGSLLPTPLNNPRMRVDEDADTDEWTAAIDPIPLN
jgi:hypothetical protein